MYLENAAVREQTDPRMKLSLKMRRKVAVTIGFKERFT